MNTKAVRIHGKMDLRLDDVTLPEMGPDDVRIRVVSDSLCMSSYKAAVEGGEHKRVPDNVEENPTIVGHEFCGVIDEVGANWQHKFKAGDGFAIQPAHFYKGSQMAPGYSYSFWMSCIIACICFINISFFTIPLQEIKRTDRLSPLSRKDLSTSKS